MKLTEDAPIDASVYRSPKDGALVVQVDTEDETGPIRVYVNDGPVCIGTPEDDRQLGPVDVLFKIEQRLNEAHTLDPQEQAQLNAQFKADVHVLLYGFIDNYRLYGNGGHLA